MGGISNDPLLLVHRNALLFTLSRCFFGEWRTLESSIEPLNTCRYIHISSPGIVCRPIFFADLVHI